MGKQKSSSLGGTPKGCVCSIHTHEKQVLLFVLHFLEVGVHQNDVSFRFFFIWFISVLPTGSFFSPPQTWKTKRSHVWQHNKNDFISNPFASFCCCYALWWPNKWKEQRNDERLFPFTKSRTINRCRLYSTHTSNTLSLPPPNGTVECQLYPPRSPSFFLFFPSSSDFTFSPRLFCFLPPAKETKKYHKEITKSTQPTTYNLR